jgi:hypothetical protein
MHPDYNDITDRLGQPLWWFDERVSVPRYEPFHPELCNIYDDTVALTTIKCQACRKEFLVSVGFDAMKRFTFTRNQGVDFKLPSKEDASWFDQWGDPPRHSNSHGDCSGETMCSEFVKINEFWMKDRENKSPTFMDWVRHPEYEFDYSEE